MKNIIKNLFLFLIVTTCAYLGVWQLDRAEQKLSIQNDYQSQSSKDYINLKSIEKNPGRYTKITAKGVFREPYFLLDNIVYNKKAGYLVMSPFQVGDKIIIVNRGWVDNLSRQKFPEITTPESVLEIKGYIKYPMKLLELSTANITKNKPYIIQNLDIDEVSSILKKDTHPFYLNLESDYDYSFTQIPEKNENKYLTHYMYAGQWFLFALIGIIFLVILNRKKHGKT